MLFEEILQILCVGSVQCCIHDYDYTILVILIINHQSIAVHEAVGHSNPKQKGRQHGHCICTLLANPHLCRIFSSHLRAHLLNISYSQFYQGNRLKIERTINLEDNLICACNITKEYILYVFITKTDLPLAF